MQADEAAELMDNEKESDRFRQRAAVVIAFFAMVLAITGLGGSNAGKEAVTNNVLASNFFNFFQAKNMRQTALVLAADQFEFAWLNDPAIPEPETNEGKKELLLRARDYEAKRDHALKQDPYFDYAAALLQIAIVLISVAIIANLVWLSFFGAAIGLVGSLLAVNGFFLLVDIPGLA